MKRSITIFASAFVLTFAGWFAAVELRGATEGTEWRMNATVIEACSCPMFCQCYFNDHPAAHGGHEGHGAGEHFCRFNNAYKVNDGEYGKVDLDGAKFWIAGDLGAEFSDGQMDWAVVTFDKATSKEQRDALTQIVGRLFPVKWKSLTTAEGTIEWTPGEDQARATLDGGKTAEVVLKRNPTAFDGSKPTVLQNLRYWGAAKNDGFVLMPNEVEAWRVGDKKFEYKGTNGFMVTFDVDSKTAPPAAQG